MVNIVITFENEDRGIETDSGIISKLRSGVLKASTLAYVVLMEQIENRYDFFTK